MPANCLKPSALLLIYLENAILPEPGLRAGQPPILHSIRQNLHLVAFRGF
jgi:hypothetical protein